jgi:hypothetical protein
MSSEGRFRQWLSTLAANRRVLALRGLCRPHLWSRDYLPAGPDPRRALSFSASMPWWTWES